MISICLCSIYAVFAAQRPSHYLRVTTNVKSVFKKVYFQYTEASGCQMVLPASKSDILSGHWKEKCLHLMQVRLLF